MIARQLVAITKTLDDLSPRTRTVFTLYRSRGLTRIQIAQRLGVSTTVVDDMIGEALDALKRCRTPSFVAD
jgi:DNA-directed RNA polymerase specialized sigma24 family protein